MIDDIVDEIRKSAELKQKVLDSPEIHRKLESLAISAIACLKQGGKIMLCGNGGSFADAQHIAAELISRLRVNRGPLPAVALGTNSSNLTAIGNDYGYENVFSRELEAIAGTDDLFIPISTSGNSPNVIAAIEAAKSKGIAITGFTGGTGGKMTSICDCIVVPSSVTDKIQEVHIMFGHILCHLVEKNMFAQHT